MRASGASSRTDDAPPSTRAVIASAIVHPQHGGPTPGGGHHVQHRTLATRLDHDRASPYPVTRDRAPDRSYTIWDTACVPMPFGYAVGPAAPPSVSGLPSTDTSRFTPFQPEVAETHARSER